MQNMSREKLMFKKQIFAIKMRELFIIAGKLVLEKIVYHKMKV